MSNAVKNNKIKFSVFVIIVTGAQIGTVVGMPVSGLLCQYFGWESVFYVFGEICFSIRPTYS